MTTLALECREQCKPAGASCVAGKSQPGGNFEAARKRPRNGPVRRKGLAYLRFLIQQKSDRPIAQCIMPKSDGRSGLVFAEAFNVQ